MLVFFASRQEGPVLQIVIASGFSLQSIIACPLGDAGIGLILNVMGIVMKKLVLLATALAMVSGSAFAADMPMKALKAPPPPAFDPWDVAFGSAIMNDYIFRGITQSNHKPSVAAYFEPRYNVTKDLQLYIGASGESISFPNRAAAEIDIYGGIRPTFGMFAFDFGVWGYIYPGGQCFGGVGPGTTNSCAAFGQGTDFGGGAGLPINGNFAKRDASFYEGYAKVNVTINDQWQVGANEYYSPNFVNLGAWGNYASIDRQVDRAEHHVRQQRRRHVHLRRVRPAVARNLGCVLRHDHRDRLRRTVPERHSGAQLQHLEYRHRLHLQGVHARSALHRHQPLEGQL